MELTVSATCTIALICMVKVQGVRLAFLVPLHNEGEPRLITAGFEVPPSLPCVLQLNNLRLFAETSCPRHNAKRKWPAHGLVTQGVGDMHSNTSSGTVTDTSQPASATSWLMRAIARFLGWKQNDDPLNRWPGKRAQELVWKIYRKSVLRTGKPLNVGMSAESAEMAVVIIDNIHPAAWWRKSAKAHSLDEPIEILFISVRSREDRSSSLLVMVAKNVLKIKQSYPLLDRSTHLHQNIY